jgi:SAM-dependent methyltransferase
VGDEEAKKAWERSAAGWIQSIRKGDPNREHLLDAPMLEMAGDLAGRRVLDTGCGEGRWCRILSQRGAVTTGADPTRPLIEEARRQDPAGQYVVAAAEDLPFDDASFDLVTSYIVLVDIADFRSAIREMARVLVPGGHLLIANLNSFATTRPRAWYQDETGKKLHVAVEDYYEERPIRLQWGDIDIVNWHRPFESIMGAHLGEGLRLLDFREPRPSVEAVARFPSMQDEYRVPLFHTMLWEKPCPSPS